MKQIALDQINQWNEDGIIREVSHTPLAVSPLLMVPKQSGDYRLCLDFRLVNACCKQIHSPPINRHAIIQDLPKKEWFSTIDISSAFTCIQLAENLQDYFGFYLEGRYYVFTRLPFGYHNSMHIFLRAIRHTLARVHSRIPKDTKILSYVDDICIASDDRDSHIKALRILFQELQRDGWVLKPEKCNILQREVKFLGIQYSKEGIKPDAGLLEKLSRLPLPTCAQHLRSLFGLSICLQRFNYKLYDILAPLRRYRSATPEAFQSSSFRSIWDTCLRRLQTEIWTTKPWNPSTTEPLRLFVDSSAQAHGAALFQGNGLISMWSVQNQRPHASSAESEITGLVRALKAFQPYLVGTKFVVYTDNRAVLSALNPENQSDVIKRHMDTIQYWFSSNLSIEHIAGTQNILADLLSRSVYLTTRSGSKEKVSCGTVQQQRGIKPAAEEIRRRMTSAHSGHWSYKTTIENALLEGPRWPKMEQDIREFVEQCPHCAFSSDSQVRDLPSTDIVTERGDQVHMDHAGPYFDGSHVLVIVDEATKYTQAKRVPNTGAKHAIKELQKRLDHMGPIKLLCTDNASAWNSKQFLSWCESSGISTRRSPSYHYRGNALAERTIQTLLHRMRRLMNGNGRTWPTVIGTAVEAMNTSWNSSIRTTPRTLAKGIDRNGVRLDHSNSERTWKRSIEARRERKEYEQRRFKWKHPRLSSAFKCGDTVLMKDLLPRQHKLGKLNRTWEGPFEIEKRISTSVWRLKRINDDGGRMEAHSFQLKKFRIVN